MPAKAFILIETAVGKTREVSNNLKQVKGIKSVDSVTGRYDVIVIVEAKDLNDIGDLVTQKVHPIKGINRTETCLVLKSD